VSDKVVVCVSDPEVAVTVTVDAPVGNGFGFVAPLVDPLHPARNIRTNKSDSVPPPMNMDLRNFFRFRTTGSSAAKPMGTKAPAANNSFTAARCRREVEYGLGEGTVYVPAVIVRVEFAFAPAVGVTEVGENWNVTPVGSPETVNVTGDAKPFEGRTLTCTVADPP